MGPDIYNVQTIEKGQLSVMAKPVSGEWIEEEFSQISNYGIKKIVSLLEIAEERTVGLSDEKTLSEKNNMSFVSFPIPDRGLPSSIEKYSNFIKETYTDISNGVNTVVHCRAGIGRTGIVAASILLHTGIEPAAAFKLISEKRGVTVPDTDEQIEWVIKNRDKIYNDT